MAKIYESKRDAWIVVLIWIGVLMCLFGVAAQLASPATPVLKVVTAIIAFFAVGFMLWALYGIRYTLTDAALMIRCGPFRYRVPLDRIDSVRPTRNPLSSPAASLDRLRIEWNKGRKRIMVSPLKKKEFMRDLERRCAQLRADGDNLISTD